MFCSFLSYYPSIWVFFYGMLSWLCCTTQSSPLASLVTTITIILVLWSYMYGLWHLLTIHSWQFHVEPQNLVSTGLQFISVKCNSSQFIHSLLCSNIFWAVYVNSLLATCVSCCFGFFSRYIDFQLALMLEQTFGPSRTGQWTIHLLPFQSLPMYPFTSRNLMFKLTDYIIHTLPSGHPCL